MSDKIEGRNYHYQAEVHYRDTLRSDYRLLRGCVEWTDFRLNEIWCCTKSIMMKFLISNANYARTSPRLEFHLIEWQLQFLRMHEHHQGKFEQYNNKVRIVKSKLLQIIRELSPFGRNQWSYSQNEVYTFRTEDGYLTSQMMMMFMSSEERWLTEPLKFTYISYKHTPNVFIIQTLVWCKFTIDYDKYTQFKSAFRIFKGAYSVSISLLN